MPTRIRKKTRCKMTLNMSVYADDSTNNRYSLPCSSADADDSFQLAAMAMKAANAQLDYAKSDVRLVAYDTKAKKYVKLVEAK